MSRLSTDGRTDGQRNVKMELEFWNRIRNDIVPTYIEGPKCLSNISNQQTFIENPYFGDRF